MVNVAGAIEEFVNQALGVNLIEMAVQIGSTIVLFLVVKFFFWNHVTDYLDKRKQEMKEEYETAARAKEEATSLKMEAEEELKEIRLTAKSIYEEAKERGEEERTRIVKEAKEHADRLLTQAHKEIEQEWENAKSDMQNEILEVASLLAQKALKQELDEVTQQRLISQISKEVGDA
jgi:F-type H+-transporting ATPase subunit b